jgi:hypothetical protein
MSSLNIRGKIRVGKYNFKTKTEPSTNGYVNILIHTSGDLSPYTMKDTCGIIMENYWQFSKIWEHVSEQNQPLSSYNMHANISERRWVHHSETHCIRNTEGQLIIQPEYWNWRRKGFSSKRWVRYPNGYSGHSKVICSIYVESYFPLIYYALNKIEARKKIYVAKYKEIATKTSQYNELLNMLNNGINIQINEVDGPTFYDEYPYNLTTNNSIEITPEILNALLNNPRQAFGHGYTLAGILMGLL